MTWQTFKYITKDVIDGLVFAAMVGALIFHEPLSEAIYRSIFE